jgi:hypothetical protein
MPLGPQFRNTFHTDEHGNMVFHTDPASVSDVDTPQSPLVEKGPEEVATGHKGVAYQGMLFSPHTATGHREDPLITEEQRRSTVRNSLGLTGANEKYYDAGKVPKKSREGYNSAIENAGYRSGIPTHMFENDVNVPTIVKKSLGKNASGDYGANGRSHAIRVREGFLPEREQVGTQEEKYYDLRQVTFGERMTNPNHVEDFKDHEQDLRADRENPGVYSYSESKRIPREQLFPGKGTSTDEYTVHNYRVNKKYGKNYRQVTAVVHTRTPKIYEGEPQTRTVPIWKTTPSIPQSTLVHEVGHSIDPHVGVMGMYNRSGHDTVKEATADGFEDRFSAHKDNYEESLRPSEKRATEIKKTGYGLATPNAKLVAPTRMHAALYAAVRQHVSMGDKNFKDVESRPNLVSEALRKSGIEPGHPNANELLLGHLYTHHAHVRDILGHLGLADEGESAANTYRKRITDAGVTHTQPAIPGFETHGE